MLLLLSFGFCLFLFSFRGYQQQATFIFGAWLVRLEIPYLSYHEIMGNSTLAVPDHSAKV